MNAIIREKEINNFKRENIKKKIKINIFYKLKNVYSNYYFIIIYIIIIFFFCFLIIYHYNFIDIEKNNIITNEEEYLAQVHKFISINNNGTLINNITKFKKTTNPKISVVITVNNGEGCLKTAVRSVQNQDFTDIEIIILDDNSQDQSEKIIKELMEEDPRIVFLKNKEQKGILYSKTKGVLNSKGKYVLSLDVDDLYAIGNAFSFLYETAENNNLDIVGFSSIQGRMDDSGFHKTSFHNYFETSIITQPELSKKDGDVLWCYFFNTFLFIKVIKEIDFKFLNTINNSCDDIFVFFLLVRRGKNLKHFKRILYVTVQQANLNNKLMKSFTEKKYKFRKEIKCLGFISYIEFVLLKSDDNFEDKRVASNTIQNFLLNHECGNDKLIRKKAIEICNLYLQNMYIEPIIKEKIESYLKRINKESNLNYNKIKRK